MRYRKHFRRFIYTKRTEKRKQCILRLQGFVRVVKARLNFKRYIHAIAIVGVVVGLFHALHHHQRSGIYEDHRRQMQ